MSGRLTCDNAVIRPDNSVAGGRAPLKSPAWPPRRRKGLWITINVVGRANTVEDMVTGLADRLRLSSWVRAVSWHRRLLAAAAAATTVILTLEALEPPAPPTVPVLVAARDLAGGSDDVRILRRPVAVVPSGAVTTQELVIGRTLAGPVRQGELITDVRMLGPPIVAGLPGKVATPVRLADPGVARLLKVGDHVDVLAAAEGTTAADVVASDIEVLAVPKAQDADPITAGALVVFATTPADAKALAGAAVAAQLTVTLLPARQRGQRGDTSQ